MIENRDELLTTLNAAGISPGVHYISNINYRMYDYARGTCPYADYVSDHVLSLPMHMYLTFDDVNRICDVIIKFVNRK